MVERKGVEGVKAEASIRVMLQETSPISAGAVEGRKGKVRVLWLHTQPEHYFNRMMDDLAGGTGYEVAGMEGIGGGGGNGRYEWVAAFSGKGPGWYAENVPKVAKAVFLKVRVGLEGRPPGFWERYHEDWRRDLTGFDVAVVSGYAIRTHREVVRECRKRGIPVLMWSDSNIRSQRGKGCKARWKRRLKKEYLAGMVGAVDYQLTANRRGVAYWRYFGAPKARIVVCPCYTDYVRLDTARGQGRAEVLGRFGFAGSERIVFTAARLVPAKGLELAIEAFKYGGFGEKGFKYVIAGQGPLEKELKALAGEALGKTIHFVGFQQPAENLALMAHSEVFLLPSRYEPHGIVVAEAMAAGVPVIASDVVGSALDLVRQGESGMFFRSGDAGDLGRKLEEALRPEVLAKLRAGARPAFEGWYRETSPMKVLPEVIGRILLERRRG